MARKEKASRKGYDPLFSPKTPFQEVFEKEWSDLTPAQKSWFRKKVVPVMHPSGRGRKPKGEYDDAYYERVRAGLLRMRPTTYKEVARKLGGSEEEIEGVYPDRGRKHDAVMQAVHRRKKSNAKTIPYPPIG